MSEVFVQQRGPRSGWGKFWVILLVIATALAGYEILRIIMIHGRLAPGSGALARAVIDGAATNALVQTVMLYAVVATPLAAFAYMTRGALTLVPLRSPEIAPAATAAMAPPPEPPRPVPSKESRAGAVVYIQAFSLVFLALIAATNSDKPQVMKLALTLYAWTIPVCIAIVLFRMYGTRSKGTIRPTASASGRGPQRSEPPPLHDPR